jgi:copper chaperone
MALQLHVPTLDSLASVKSLEETIYTSQPDATVKVDLEAKTVTITSQASEETFKQLIVAAGHRISNAS